MSIKNVKPSSRYRGGKYTPINEKKYVGHGPIIYRSGWEKKYCLYCDNNEDIISWSSEPVAIDYYYPWDKKWHKYYPDFWIKVKTTSGSIKEYLIEIKPKSSTKLPKAPKRNTAKSVKNYKYAVKTYIKNLSKAKAAKKFAAERKMQFIIITEDSLK